MNPQKALVRVSYGNRGVAQGDDGSQLECQYRRSVGRPICGDVIEYCSDKAGGYVVNGIDERRNVFARADRRGRKQVIAANLDQVVIVIAPSPAPSRDLVDRYLVAARSLDIEPVLLLNKTDLLDQFTAEPESPLNQLHRYKMLGYTVARVHCAAKESNSNPSVEELESLLTDKTSILVGQSGVGKSSLANAVLPDLELQTGALSRVTGKGTHTTTTTIMYELPCGGWLVDSPGVWEYGLWDMDDNQLLVGFPELQKFTAACRFNNCLHDHEPGCGVREAAQSDELVAWRYQSYLRLLTQNA